MAKRLLEQRWPWVVAACVLLLIFLSSFVEIRVGGEADPRPLGSIEDIERLRERDDLNILFIVIDTLRADHLGMYGYELETSPKMDALASTGIRFARNLTQSSWTKASMASLWTSLYPTRTGITRFNDVLPDEAQMPAEVLRDAGFRTAGIYRNGWVAEGFGFSQGFEVYVRPVGKALPQTVLVKNPTLKDRSTDDSALSSALEFLRIHGSQRWFLYLHMMDLHEYLYDEESALFGGSYSANYDNSIRWTDGTIDVLMSHLAGLGHLDDTLIVIASDHGEAFLERGHEGHAQQLYRETTEVPLILLLPFRLEPGVVVEARTQNVNIWPTVFDLVGVPLRENVDGRSRVPEILAAARGTAPPTPPAEALAHLDRHWGQRGRDPNLTVSVVDGSLRYVRVDDEAGRTVERLFDSEGDPREKKNWAEERPEELERLRGMADAHLATEPPWGEAPTREIDELELNQLRALGYAIP